MPRLRLDPLARFWTHVDRNRMAEAADTRPDRAPVNSEAAMYVPSEWVS